MQILLTELSPRWIDSGARKGLGVEFLCPCDGGHPFQVWFLNPRDGSSPVTLTNERPHLYSVAGEFGTLTIGEGVAIAHGDCLVVVRDGLVTVMYTEDGE